MRGRQNLAEKSGDSHTVERWLSTGNRRNILPSGIQAPILLDNPDIAVLVPIDYLHYTSDLEGNNGYHSTVK